jgi:hypothetical protein
MSQERVAIDAVKQQLGKDLNGTCLAYLKLSNQVENDATYRKSQLPADSAKLAVFDIAFGEFHLSYDNADALIYSQDAQKRIDTARQSGIDVRKLQKEEDKLKAKLPSCEITGGS